MAYDDEFKDDFSDFDDTIDESSITSEQNENNVAEEKLYSGKQRFLDGEFPTALDWFRDAVENGCVRGYYFLGLMYKEGLGVAEDQKQAEEYWQTGADQGDELCAICLLDEDMFTETYDDEDSEAAQHVLEQIDEDSFFAVQIAELCIEYESILLDAAKEKPIFEKAANEGNVIAMYELYKFYKDDNKPIEALQMLKNAAAAHYPKAMLKIGKLYECGDDGYEQDIEQALSYYKQAKDANCKEANLYLGNFYYARQEYKSAFTYIKRAAKSGYAEAMFKLGLMYKNGWGVKQKLDEAQQWLEKAKAEGYEEVDEYDERPVAEAYGEMSTAEAFDNELNDEFIAKSELADSGVKEDADIREADPPNENVDFDNEFNREEDFIITEAISEPIVAPQPMTQYADQIEALKLNGLTHREATKKLIAIIVGEQQIPCWKFLQQIDTKMIVEANNHYAGRNLPFDVMAIFDDALIPVFKGRSGVMLTSKKLITSQPSEVQLEDIKDVVVVDKTLKVECDNGESYRFDSKKKFADIPVIRELILALAYMAKIYRS